MTSRADGPTRTPMPSEGPRTDRGPRHTFNRRFDDFDAYSPTRAEDVRVLIVDDDPNRRLTLASMLAPLGYSTVEAGSADEARQFVTRQNFAVIVLDVRSPACDGFETAAFIRANDETKLTPIVFITAIDRPEKELALGYSMGSADFIVGPIVPSALRGKVELSADLFAKTQELVVRARRLRLAATRSDEALAFQLEMLSRMEELSRAKSDFVSKISHELRSPLTSVIGYVELLMDATGSEIPSHEQARMLAIIERNSLRLLSLIEDLLTLSRVEAGLFELEVGPVDLRDVIENVRETTAPAVAKAEVELFVALGPDQKLIGDRGQIERALLNLVSNAVKFNVPTGRIDITTRTENDEIVVSVGDTGLGVPPDEQEHLFTKFYRATRSKEQEVPGTGLGLYIVKQIVELHGGTITLESTPDGSTFAMRLPVCGPPADALALVRGR